MLGRAPKTMKQYMKIPSKAVISKPLYVDFPIMDAWDRRVHNAVVALPRSLQKVVFERYLGHVWERYDKHAHAKELQRKVSTFQRLLTTAHKLVEKRINLGDTFEKCLTRLAKV